VTWWCAKGAKGVALLRSLQDRESRMNASLALNTVAMLRSNKELEIHEQARFAAEIKSLGEQKRSLENELSRILACRHTGYRLLRTARQERDRTRIKHTTSALELIRARTKFKLAMSNTTSVRDSALGTHNC
jgi:hypothetical protein